MNQIPREKRELQPADDWLSGGGEMAALMRSTDWSKTELGPIEDWPRSLRTVVGVLLGSRFPMMVWWGDRCINLYNDAYRPILRDKHPASLAAPAARVWAEIWDFAGPLARGVLEGGPATWMEDVQLFIKSGDMAEETYFTFSYSPVPGDDGRVGGLLNTVQETTLKVQGERQVRMLHDLAALAAEARSEDEAYRRVAEVLAADDLDLPFTLLYALGANGARLVAASGWNHYEGPAKPAHIALAADACTSWPIDEAIRSGQRVRLDDLAERFGPLPMGRWEARPERAILWPLVRVGEASPYAIMVTGVSPHRALDERYQRFFQATVDQVASVIANARAYEGERKRAEALAEIDRAKTAFFSNVSHEFRTPLTLILGPIEDALARAEHSLSGNDLEMVHRNALRLLRLVNALLDFSRIEAGRARASFEGIDLAMLTAQLASEFRSAVEQAGLKLIVRCDPLPKPVFVDREMWEQIVLNLLSNAFKFTLEGEIEAALATRGDGVELIVRDTGVGVAADELPRLFERFHRIEGARARTHEGSGIGLALVQELVRMHDGEISAESEPGKGTLFRVRLRFGSEHLPADQVGVKPISAPTARRSAAFLAEALRWQPEGDRARTVSAPRADAPARILVVDDNADLRAYLCHLLMPHYAVEAVADGVEALNAIRVNRPDLIITDVMMPNLDGFGLLRAVRENPETRTLKVIMLSARAGQEASIEGMSAGADDYLAKPFMAPELLARVRTHLSMERAREAYTASLARANRELEAFSYSVSHDLRAPLRSIDGFAQALLEDHANLLDETGRDYLRRVCGAAQKMGELIDDLLFLSRVNRAELKHESIDLSELARTAASELQRREPERGLALVIQEGLTARGDRRLIRIALENLLGNAWKFTAKVPQARIEFGTTMREGASAFFVRDNGAGFDMVFADKLFTPFKRLHADRDFPGTGIGLATVSRIVTRHGGRVWAEGAVDQGACIYFSIPPGDAESLPAPGSG